MNKTMEFLPSLFLGRIVLNLPSLQHYTDNNFPFFAQSDFGLSHQNQLFQYAHQRLQLQYQIHSDLH